MDGAIIMAEEVHRVRSRIVLSSSDATEAQLVPPKHGPYDLRAFLSHDGRLNKETGFPRRGGEHRRAPSFDGFDGEGHEVDITSAIGLRKTLSLRRKKSSVGVLEDGVLEDVRTILSLLVKFAGLPEGSLEIEWILYRCRTFRWQEQTCEHH